MLPGDLALCRLLILPAAQVLVGRRVEPLQADLLGLGAVVAIDEDMLLAQGPWTPVGAFATGSKTFAFAAISTPPTPPNRTNRAPFRRKVLCLDFPLSSINARSSPDEERP